MSDVSSNKAPPFQPNFEDVVRIGEHSIKIELLTFRHQIAGGMGKMRDIRCKFATLKPVTWGLSFVFRHSTGHGSEQRITGPRQQHGAKSTINNNSTVITIARCAKPKHFKNSGAANELIGRRLEFLSVGNIGASVYYGQTLA